MVGWIVPLAATAGDASMSGSVYGAWTCISQLTFVPDHRGRMRSLTKILPHHPHLRKLLLAHPWALAYASSIALFADADLTWKAADDDSLIAAEGVWTPRIGWVRLSIRRDQGLIQGGLNLELFVPPMHIESVQTLLDEAALALRAEIRDPFQPNDRTMLHFFSEADLEPQEQGHLRGLHRVVIPFQSVTFEVSNGQKYLSPLRVSENPILGTVINGLLRNFIVRSMVQPLQLGSDAILRRKRN